MHKDSRICVVGHRGLAGSAIVRRLRQLKYTHVLLRSRSELDLTDAPQVDESFRSEKPEYVFLAAANEAFLSHVESDCLVPSGR